MLFRSYYLSTGNISKNASAPGLDGVRKQLKLDSMSKAELNSYYKHVDNLVIMRDGIVNSRLEGIWEGRKEGLAEGLTEGRAEGFAQGIKEGKIEALTENARKMKAANIEVETICKITGLNKDCVENL